MDTTTVLIIGSGFGGQVTAINLLRRGITDFRILERRDFMGGTWCQNSYPGAAVDVRRRSTRSPPSPTRGPGCTPSRPSCATTPSTSSTATGSASAPCSAPRSPVRSGTARPGPCGPATARPPWPLPGQRLRPAQHPGRTAFAGLDDFAGRLPHQRLGPRRRPGWQARRRHRLGRQRRAGDPRDPAEVAQLHVFSAAPTGCSPAPTGSSPGSSGAHCACVRCSRPCAPRSTGSSRPGSSASSTAAGC